MNQLVFKDGEIHHEPDMKKYLLWKADFDPVLKKESSGEYVSKYALSKSKEMIQRKVVEIVCDFYRERPFVIRCNDIGSPEIPYEITIKTYHDALVVFDCMKEVFFDSGDLSAWKAGRAVSRKLGPVFGLSEPDGIEIEVPSGKTVIVSIKSNSKGVAERN